MRKRQRQTDSYLVVFNAQPTGTVISNGQTGIQKEIEI